MYTERVINIVDGNKESNADEARFRGLINVINAVTEYTGDDLSWDQSRGFDSNYVGSNYEYTTTTDNKEA
jgi:hypothetical protein